MTTPEETDEEREEERRQQEDRDELVRKQLEEASRRQHEQWESEKRRKRPLGEVENGQFQAVWPWTSEGNVPDVVQSARNRPNSSNAKDYGSIEKPLQEKWNQQRPSMWRIMIIAYHYTM